MATTGTSTTGGHPRSTRASDLPRSLHDQDAGGQRPARKELRAAAAGTGLAYVVLGALAAYLFHGWAFVHPPQKSAHSFHIGFARDAALGGEYPPHFLYHGALNLLSGFSGELGRIRLSAVILLTACVLLKLVVSISFARVVLRREGYALGAGALLLLPALFFAGPIINWWQFPRVYIGQISPTVWHNPTVIAAMPLCVGCWMMLERGRAAGPRAALAGSLLLALSILVKPNFALAFLPALLVLTLLARRGWIELAVYGLPAVACLLWLFLRAYAGAGAGISFRPMEEWGYLTDRPLAALGVSIAFPVCVLAFFWRRLCTRRGLAAAWTLALVAIAQYALLAEEGERVGHGNFYWGSVMALYILFLVSIVELVLQRADGRPRARIARGICWLVLVLHVLGGALFYAHAAYGLSPRKS